MVKLFYRLIYILPLTLFGAGLICSEVFGEPLSGRELFLVAIFAAFVPILSRLSTQMKIIVSGGTLIVTAAVIFVALRLDKSTDHAGVIREVIIILIALGLSAVSFIVVKSRAVKLVAALGLVGFLAVSMFLRFYVTRLEIWLCLLFVLSFAVEEFQRIYRGGETFEKEKYVTFVWPFVFALSLAVAVIKAPARPYDWDLFIKIYERGKELTIELREKLFYSHSEDYNDSMIGFSGDARIGGDVGGRAEEIMSISTARRTNQTLYLTGKVFGEFDGREWTPVKDFSNKERVLDSLIAICSAQMYGQQNSSDYVRLENMDITFLPFSSKYVFAPSKYVSITMDNNDFSPSEKDGALLFDQTQIVNTSYRILYANINTNPLAIETVISGGKKPDEVDWRKTLTAYGSTVDPELTLAKMEEYVAYVKSHYSGGVSVSDDIAESLEKIKEAGGTDYERLKILEKTLNSMTYTTSPGKLPAQVTDPKSFLDYFLTESQEGYCAHYATAFCLMARAMGYPSRYVQGYMLTVKQSSDTRVDSSMAHAWPEVWLDGIGWISFEPTPGRATADGGWQTTDERHAEEALNANNGSNNPYDTVGEEEYFELEKDKEEPEKTKLEWYVFVIPIVSFILFAALFMLVDSLVARHRLKKAPADEKAYILSRRNMRMLAYMGYKKGPGETLNEFMNRVGGEDLGDSLSFIPCFERVLYSGRAIDNDSLTTIQISEESIRRLLKSKKKLLYIIYRFRSIHGR